MQDNQYRTAQLGKLANRVQGAVLMLRIEHGCRFVKQQYLPGTPRPELGEHPSEVHALLLASGQ